MGMTESHVAGGYCIYVWFSAGATPADISVSPHCRHKYAAITPRALMHWLSPFISHYNVYYPDTANAFIVVDHNLGKVSHVLIPRGGSLIIIVNKSHRRKHHNLSSAPNIETGQVRIDVKSFESILWKGS